MMTIKSTVTPRLWRSLQLAGVPVFATIFLIFTLTLLPDQMASAQTVDAHAQFYPAPQVMTLTTGAVGDPLARIQCGAGYSATIYAEGLSNPDGLAFSPGGVLHVAEEGMGRISKIASNGTVSTLVGGLTNPEGIAFNNDGTLFVVEDVITQGRVISVSTGGVMSVLASGLDSPEGIVWVSDGNPKGTLYFTESTLEYFVATSSTLSIPPSNQDFPKTYITELPVDGSATRILTKTADVSYSIFPASVNGTFWSFSGITFGSDNLLYVANELAGQEINETINYMGFNVVTHLTSTNSIFTLNPASPATEPAGFTDNQLIAPEGVRFSHGGGFPLYVAEEDTGSGFGRISKVQSNGTRTPFCTGFEFIEDVVLDDSGRLYVSEDSTGYVIQIEYTSSITGGVYLPIILR